MAGLKGDLIKLELEGKRQINQINQQIEQLNAELAGLRSERAQLNANLTEVRVTNKNQTLRAPVSGIVFDLKLNNPGYISQAQSSQAALKGCPFQHLGSRCRNSKQQNWFRARWPTSRHQH